MLDQDINEILLESTKNNLQEKKKSRMDILMSSIHHSDPVKGQEFHGHTGNIWCCAITSDSTFIFSGSDDTLIKIWSIPSSAFSGDLDGHTAMVCALAISSDDKSLISGGSDNQIIVWDWKERTQRRLLNEHMNQITALALSNNDKFLVSCAFEYNLKIWNLDEVEDPKNIYIADIPLAVIITKDLTEAIAGGANGTIIICSLLKCEVASKQSLDSGVIQCMALTPDNTYLIIGTKKYDVIIIKYSDKSQHYHFKPHQDEIRNISCTRDGEYFITSSSDKATKIFNLKTKIEAVKLEGSGFIYGQCLSTDGQFLVTGATDKIVRAWRIGQPSRVAQFGEHPKTIRCLAIDKESKIIITGCEDSVVRKWKLEDFSLEAQLEGHTGTVLSVLVTNNHRYIASGSQDHDIILWGFESCKVEATLKGHTDFVFSIAATTDSMYLASASRDFTVGLWDIGMFSLIRLFKGHTDTIFCVIVTKYNTEIISSSADFSFRIWDFHGEKNSVKIVANGIIDCLALSHDEKYLAIGCRDNNIYLWDWVRRTMLKKFGFHTGWIKSLRFLDSRKLLSASLDSTIRLWDCDEERHEFVLQGHKGNVWSALCSEDGKCVISAGNDMNIRLWYIQELKELELMDIGGAIESFLYLVNIKNKAKPQLAHTQAIFSSLKVNLAHIYSYLGHEDLLKEALNMGTDIRMDDDMNSPLHYALRRRSQSCIDVIFQFLTNLKDNEFEKFLNYACALRRDFESLLENRSEHLPEFLEALFFRLPDVSNFAAPRVSLPSLVYSLSKQVNLYDFVYHISEIPSDTLEVPVEFKTMPFPIFYIKGSSGSIDILESISSCSNRRILQTDFVKTYIRNKWDSLWGYILALTILMWTNLLLMTIGLILYANHDMDSVYYIGSVLGFVIVNAILAGYEIMQAITAGRAYFRDVWNLIDMVRISLCSIWVVMSFLDTQDYITYVAWFMVLANFLRGLSGFRAFDNTRFFSRLIRRAFFDSLSFLLIFLYSTLAIGVLYLVPNSQEKLEKLWTSPYELSMGGFDNKDMDFLEYFGFMIATLINVIIILNLLISILGDSFDSFQAESNEIDTLDMAELVIELETLISWNRGVNTKMYMTKCQEMTTEGNTNWEGRIKAMLSAIDSVKKESNENYKKLMKSDELLNATLKEFVEISKKNNEAFEKIVRENHEQLLKLMKVGENKI